MPTPDPRLPRDVAARAIKPLSRHRARCPRITLLVLVVLGGCVADSSNPGLMIRSAEVDAEGAQLVLDLGNPGGRELCVTRLDYHLSHGESAWPVAEGTWAGTLDLPARGSTTLNLDVPFQTPPIEQDSHLLLLRGEMFFVDRTGYLGLQSMDLTGTAFQATVEAKERRR